MGLAKTVKGSPAVRRTIVGSVVFTVVLLACGWSLRYVRQGQDAIWDVCLGKRLSDCRVPSGFTKPGVPCPDYLDCHTVTPGVRHAFSTSTTATPTVWASTSYAVIALDAAGRIVAVEMKRRYAAP